MLNKARSLKGVVSDKTHSDTEPGPHSKQPLANSSHSSNASRAFSPISHSSGSEPVAAAYARKYNFNGPREANSTLDNLDHRTLAKPHDPSQAGLEQAPMSRSQHPQSMINSSDMAVGTSNSLIPFEIETKKVPIVLTIEDTQFLLLSLSEDQMVQFERLVPLMALFENTSLLESSIGELFEIIRTDDDLVELHNYTKMDELVLTIPELNGIKISEDNIYTRNILINDFTKMFNALTYKTASEDLNFSHLNFSISVQPRFITDFNALNDSIRRGHGFESVHSNRFARRRRHSSDAGSNKNANVNDSNDDNKFKKARIDGE
ncbi:hypothetical protein PSN45_000826 [Yamadazyma tenuis]|uniref:Uncharacterized protein n=1 Tax=Candida tenuis (strain ATCC 10573 / BCRC 21748 / CBS 615 / JCM 9827 / NBRC 10315 / NRRL Y-1498 / VKM Y-70) TaxID=590646 RepID=G3BAU6_CANTC|nr:uncharacterized protein CANTEDRAFT_94997 [Yamadazyma tenuis ATCC 10573]EGV62114.1 hypothetical protein CANTEDRAFT_94997 [Yamadazyma tenuis ATCC 10573]WEJ93363.1 hypothetical protein PSN45_000826 [Yamadazyma tenuis]